jgi:beta-xylosidase
MTWSDDWPVISEESLPHVSGRPGIVSADDFASDKLSLVWQWNHNPADGLWSLADRRGWLRLKTDRIDGDLLSARNTLTQRCWGPTCSAAAKIDIGGLANGDNAGLALFQRDYVSLSATKENGTSYLVLRRAEDGNMREVARVQVSPCSRTVWVRAYGDFSREPEKDKLWNFPGRDEGWFAYSTDGKSWTPIGGKFHLEYTAPHFTGYRFALYMYSTLKSGGYADFDWFRLTDSVAR